MPCNDRTARRSPKVFRKNRRRQAQRPQRRATKEKGNAMHYFRVADIILICISVALMAGAPVAWWLSSRRRAKTGQRGFDVLRERIP